MVNQPRRWLLAQRGGLGQHPAEQGDMRADARLNPSRDSLPIHPIDQHLDRYRLGRLRRQHRQRRAPHFVAGVDSLYDGEGAINFYSKYVYSVRVELIDAMQIRRLAVTFR
jgi:hypothetical protein